MISTHAISYMTLKNIGEVVPNLCQEVGFLGRIKEGGGVLVLTNGKVLAMQASEKGDSRYRGQEDEIRKR